MPPFIAKIPNRCQFIKMEKVTVAIFGGLGNQLFQYAMGRALSLRTRRSLELDLRFYEHRKAFDFGLNHFNIQATIGTPDSLPPARTNRLRYFYWRYLSARNTFIREGNKRRAGENLQTKDNIYLHGYWQSENHFLDSIAQIRCDLSPVQPPTKQHKEILLRVNSCNSVAIHVRRGDYVSNPKAKKIYAECPNRYYKRAIRMIEEKTNKSTKPFIFSDDPEWAADNLNLGVNSEIVSTDPPSLPSQELWTMANCMHQVIANSTFSWWAAWLNKNPEKIVVAPKQWMRSRTSSELGLIPNGWLVVDNCIA